MKPKLLLAATVMTLTLISGAYAGDIFTSPKGAQLLYDLRKLPGTTPDMLDRSIKFGSPKDLAFKASLRKVPETTQEMLVRNLPAVPPRLLANEPWRYNSSKSRR